MVDVLKFMLKMGRSAPFSEYVAKQTDPDMSQMSDDDLLE